MPVTFPFYRYRFHFRAIDRIHFPAGTSANAIRGAFGNALRESAPANAYRRLFEPGAGLRRSPSGLGDWPRPFIFRAYHLGSRSIPSGDSFFLDVHLFDLREPAVSYFRDALTLAASRGLGPGRGRAVLERIDQLDLMDRAEIAAGESGPPLLLLLDAENSSRVAEVTVCFRTPTELKGEGGLVERPEFPILFARLRDRISTLSTLYGEGPLAVDFRGLGERAVRVHMVHCDLVWERTRRRSARTGQVHSIGGFTGEARYQGDLGEFMPWLRAARWVGVGRQTVWGKGDVRVRDPETPETAE
jgi:hypothetical protein